MSNDPVLSKESLVMYPGGAETSAGPAAAAGPGSCQQCGSVPGFARNLPSTAWVYALGRIVPRFPDLGVEKEFAQAGAGGAAGMLETERLIAILKQDEFRYLARQLCWVFHNGETETFTLLCRDDAEAERLVNAIPRADAAEQTVQVIVGSMGFAAVEAACATTGLPAVAIDHHLTFTIDSFIDALAGAQPGGKGGHAEAKADEGFRAAAKDLFARLTRRSDNRGLTDEHRALNYVALRYPPIYRLVADAHRDDKSLVDVQVRRGPGGARRLVAVRMVFRARRTDVVERYQCLVDVTDRFPFLSTSINQVYD